MRCQAQCWHESLSFVSAECTEVELRELDRERGEMINSDVPFVNVVFLPHFLLNLFLAIPTQKLSHLYHRTPKNREGWRRHMLSPWHMKPLLLVQYHRATQHPWWKVLSALCINELMASLTVIDRRERVCHPFLPESTDNFANSLDSQFELMIARQ